jgi:hypothetical protein
MQYLVAIHHPDDYDPAIAEGEEMERDIDVLNFSFSSDYGTPSLLWFAA